MKKRLAAGFWIRRLGLKPHPEGGHYRETYRYAGATLSLFCLTAEGEVKRLQLGKSGGAVPQAVVRAGWWFGAEVAGRRGYALIGCTVAPGFDFRDFEMAERNVLLRRFPRHRRLVERLT